ncbi:MAG: hypothetical protein O2798_03230 [Chloroflexi bacterium]|nr:hypothetical protein [Chloroflexota bacterium]MDA1239836.1 hypothetical protein [Chloroflexota bacterium]
MRRFLKFVLWVGAFKAVIYVLLRVYKSSTPANPDPIGDEFDLAVVAEATEFGSSASALRRASATVACGGLYLDLRDARLAPGGARLSLRVTLGGVDVVVPPSWRVVLRGPTMIGGLSANITAHEDLPADAPTLVIDAHVTLGGVHVRAVAGASR